MAYVGQDGSLQTSIVIANSSLDEFQPSVAYNPVQNKALVVYTVRIDQYNYSVRGRFVQGSSVSAEFGIGDLYTQPSPQVFFTPDNALAYDQVNNTWLVAWNFFNYSPYIDRDEIHYRALAANGTPLLREEVVVIPSGMNRKHLSLACSDPNAVAPNCAFATHSDPSANQQKLRLDRVFLRSIPPWLGESSGSAGR